MNKINKKIVLSMFVFLVGLFSFVFVSAVGGQFTYDNTGAFSGTGSYQYFRPSFNSIYSSDQINTYWPILNDIQNDKCEETNDFLISIPPVGCEPAVVRSDLLEEQNVPVFCQLDAIQVNPLIKVSSIESINFQGDYPEEVAGISFHPARAAVRTHDALLGSPLLNNIGYVVIVLKRNPVEANMPDLIKGNLTATIRYDAEEAFGAGRAEFILPVMDDFEWDNKYKGYSFWNGRGFVRVHSMTEDGAKIGLYTDRNRLLQEITLKKGQTSREIYFPGFYCRAGLKVRLNDLDSAQSKVKLQVDGDDIWVAEGGRFLDGKCRVTSLDPLGEDTGSVQISCNGNKRFELSLSRNGANFSNRFVEIGKSVEDGSREKLVYIGEVPSEVSGFEDGAIIAVTYSGDYEEQLTGVVADRIYDYVGRNTISKNSFEGTIKNVFGSTEKDKVKIYDNFKDKAYFYGFGSELKDSKQDSRYFEGAYNNATELAESNFNNERNLAGDYFGELGLLEAAQRAESLGNQKSKAELLELFLETYPGSDSADYVQEELTKLKSYDTSNAGNSVYVNNEYTHISLKQFDKVGLDEKSVSFNFASEIVGEEGELCLEDGKLRAGRNCSYLRVDKINYDRVRITLEKYDKENDNYKETRPVTLYLKGYGDEDVYTYDGRSIFIRDLKVEEEASISIIPEVDNTKSEANFTFNVGIEKRNIKLSPEKTEEMLKNLDESIERWEDRLEKLGKVVTAWKGACFATSAFMMVSSFASNLNGEAIGRQKVMEHYKKICDDAISSKKAVGPKDIIPSSRTECYNALSTEINGDVDRSADIIEQINNDLKPTEKEKLESGGLFGGTAVNRTAQKLRLASSESGGWDIPPEVAEQMTLEEMRDYRYWKQMEAEGNSLVAKEGYAASEAKSVIEPAQKRAQAKVEREKMKGELGVVPHDLDGSRTVLSLQDSDKIIDSLSLANPNNGDDQNKYKYQVVRKDGKSYVVKTERYRSTAGTNNYRPIEVSLLNTETYTTGGTLWSQGTATDKDAEGDVLTAQEIGEDYAFVESTCQNPFKEEPKVKFYQSSPNKYLPAIVPFDKEKGWYVKVSQSNGGVFSQNVQGYQASGAVEYYTICNVGEDGREENTLGDDICQGYSIHGSDNTFGGCTGLTGRQVESLKNNAMRAIQEASQQYGDDKIRVNGELYDSSLSAAGETGLECQDFMSPENCKILFNVCDPVICPTSRCNLGGKYSVSNVVQSGIIGSLLLCLPNAKEGVAVPVCLTGVHAGLEGYVSILKSEQACLQESLDTGRNVGICDEITSVYTCEFFWRQMAPMMDIIIPKTIEYAYGVGGARGGAEYLSVQAAWQNMQSNIDFFRNTYASTSFQAFNFRNIQEAGSEVCRAYVGTSLPSEVDLVDGLLAPESPSQFYARFDESPLNGATIPPTSQYKVYYHIFAGNDKGRSYSIYLKNPPESSYYHSNPFVTVKSGYIAKGEQVDEAVDFSAPAGYKELCVVVDAQTECGFTQVSTSFAVDYLNDKIVAERAEEEGITTEKGCVSGTPSVLALANPNLGAGASDLVDPRIEMNGIVRVCATQNPSKGVDETRWKEVGYCGNSNLRCWLDRSSVDEEIKRVQAVEGITLDETEKALLEGEMRNTSKATISKLVEIRKEIDGLTNNPGLDGNVVGLNKRLTEIYLQNGASNYQKAEALYYKVVLYSKAVSLTEGEEVKERTKGIEDSRPATNPDTEDANAETLAEEPEEPVVEEEPEEVIDYGLSSDNKRYKVNGEESLSDVSLALRDKDIEITPYNLLTLNDLERAKYGNYNEVLPKDLVLVLSQN